MNAPPLPLAQAPQSSLDQFVAEVAGVVGVQASRPLPSRRATAHTTPVRAASPLEDTTGVVPPSAGKAACVNVAGVNVPAALETANAVSLPPLPQ